MTIGDSFLALHAIRNGELIVPYQIGLVSAQSYSLYRPLGRAAKPASQKFEAWLRGAIQAYQANVLQVLSDIGIRVIDRPKT